MTPKKGQLQSDPEQPVDGQRLDLSQFFQLPASQTFLDAADALLKTVPAGDRRSVAWRSLDEKLPLREQIAYLLCCSDFVRDTLQRDPTVLPRLVADELHLARDEDTFATSARQCLHRDKKKSGAGKSAALSTEDDFMCDIRRWRSYELCRIAWRDLIGFADTTTILLELSLLADSAVQVADDFSFQMLTDRFGYPCTEGDHDTKSPQRLVTLAMGKLGAFELNFSSDIDLIYTYPSAGHMVAGSKSASAANEQISVEQFFHRQVQMIVRLLSKATSDGFVYRVDLRLRPFGTSGPLALTFEGLRHYYLTQGREWERYAMIKARPVTGTFGEAEQLQQILQPFIYRRYPDYSVFESLRDLKSRIAGQLQAKGGQDNIKTGPGGIREIEFIGQAFQLLHGGRDTDLQQRGILVILDLLPSRGWLLPEQVEQLKAAYDYLRRLENRLQMLRDEQTHAFPSQVTRQAVSKRQRPWSGRRQRPPAVSSKPVTSKKTPTENATGTCSTAESIAEPNDGQRIALAMQCQDISQLQAELDVHRQHVHRIFSELFRIDDVADIDALEQPLPELDKWRSQLVQAGFFDAETLANTINNYLASTSCQSLTEAAQRRVQQLILLLPQLAARASQSAAGADSRHTSVDASLRQTIAPDSGTTLLRMLALIRNVSGRSGYLQILLERPEALELLAGLVARSSWLTEFIISHPIVIDELLDQRTITQVPNSSDIDADALRLRPRLKREELDLQMDALRHFKSSQTMRIVIAWLLEQIDVEETMSLLTQTAESSLSLVADLVVGIMRDEHGMPLRHNDTDGEPAEFAIVGYGKLGSGELGLGSDLDIIFLHEGVDENVMTDGDNPLESVYFLARLARKIVHFVTTLTPAGVLYPIDTRLRPNGRAGMLVSSLDAFSDYQSEQAWIWEHQALVRARVIVGSEAFTQGFEQVRTDVLARKRDKTEVAEAVSEMRRKMAQNHSGHAGSRFDYKQGRGGIIDIEFIVQYLVLIGAASHPQLLESRDNLQLLTIAADLQMIEPDAALLLRKAYLCWQIRLHEQSLQQATKLEPSMPHEMPDSDGSLCEQVVGIWNNLLPAYH